MGKLLFVLLLLLLFVLMALPVLLYQWLGWMGLPLAILFVLLLGWLLKMSAGHITKQLFMMPFKAKGAVLRDAQTRVHAVTPAAPPESAPDFQTARPDEMSNDEWAAIQAEEDKMRRERAARRYYHVDVTITPRAPSGSGFTMWEPGELLLAPPDVKSAGLDDDQEEVGAIEDVEIWQDGAWHEKEDEKYHGPLRVKLLVGILPEITRARFRYYFEVFGEVEFALPPPAFMEVET